MAAADEPVDEVEEVEEAEGMPWEEPVQAGGGDSTDDLVDDQLTSWPMPLPPLPPLPPLGEHDGPPP